MKQSLIILKQYVYTNYGRFLRFLLYIGLLCLFQFLYGSKSAPLGYGVFLVFFFASLFESIRFYHFYQKYIVLKQLQQIQGLPDVTRLNASQDMIEANYQQLLKQQQRYITQLEETYQQKNRDLWDYYELWAHQIKTPISVIHLLIQSQDAEENMQIEQELLKIEQYLEMMLHYLQLTQTTNDLLFKRHSLVKIINQTVRKFSVFFIQKRMSLHITIPKEVQITTDEKWFGFAVEQLLSNALKYTTNGGEINIYLTKDNQTLHITDNGVGIRKEDLPRIFEKGFTGYNGHLDKKATGIGLYLTQMIIQRLACEVEIDSVVGKGTDVSIHFEN